MHPFFASAHSVPAFLVKLWKLVTDPSTDDLISWTHNGSSFTICDAERFARELLPLYFKHNNNASFIRQLNMYGFRKVMNYDKTSDSKEWEFQHAFFSRDKVELLTNIKRKPAVARVAEPDASFSSNDVLFDLTTIREKQKNMDTTLTKMKKENELLWRELSNVKQRHKAQEQVLHKVIQFLVQIIQRSNQSIHVPRKLARMLQDSSVCQENSSQVARIVDVLREKDTDCIIIPDEEDADSLGAVIHEVTDFEPEISNNKQSSSVPKFTSSILKPLANGSKKNLLSSNLSSSTSSLEPLSVLENLQDKSDLAFKEYTVEKNSLILPTKYIAIPVHGDSNKLVLIPQENFTSQEISNFKENSSYNVIALPDKDTKSITDSDVNSLTENNKSNFSNEKTSVTADSNDSLQKMSNKIISELLPATQKQVPSEFPLLKNDFDDSYLSDLLQASKISNIDDNQTNSLEICTENRVTQSPMDKDVSSNQISAENPNNQLAIPGPSSLVKSTKNNFPDFNILQDTTNPTPSIETKVLEQLFTSDDFNYETFINQLSNDKDVNMGNSIDDISGNELVQFSPKASDDISDPDQFHWLDFLNHDSYSSESIFGNDFLCEQKDVDFGVTTNNEVLSPGLDAIKIETELTSCLRKPCNYEKKNKRRKVK